jgi:hypothetical protein
MSNKRIDILLEKRTALLKELGKNAWLLRGTWVERYSTCMRPDCKCHQGEKHGPRHYVAIMRNGKQRQVYVRRQHESLVRAGLARSQTIDDILLQITEINLELLKEGAYDDVQP